LTRWTQTEEMMMMTMIPAAANFVKPTAQISEAEALRRVNALRNREVRRPVADRPRSIKATEYAAEFLRYEAQGA
jgi:hypothetical protein